MFRKLILLLAALNVSASEFPLPYNSENQPGEPMPAAEAAPGLLMTWTAIESAGK